MSLCKEMQLLLSLFTFLLEEEGRLREDYRPAFGERSGWDSMFVGLGGLKIAPPAFSTWRWCGKIFPKTPHLFDRLFEREPIPTRLGNYSVAHPGAIQQPIQPRPSFTTEPTCL